MTDQIQAITPARRKKKNADAGRSVRAQDVRLNFLLQDVARLQKDVFDEYMAPLNITRSHWLIVTMLSRHDGMTQTQLAGMLDISKANLGAMLHRMTKAGLIERGTHPVDGRAKSVYLSKHGQRLLDEIRTHEANYVERVLAGLNDSERDTLFTLLHSVKRALAPEGTALSGL